MCSKICDLLPGHKHIKIVKVENVYMGPLVPENFGLLRKYFKFTLIKYFSVRTHCVRHSLKYCNTSSNLKLCNVTNNLK